MRQQHVSLGGNHEQRRERGTALVWRSRQTDFRVSFNCVHRRHGKAQWPRALAHSHISVWPRTVASPSHECITVINIYSLRNYFIQICQRPEIRECGHNQKVRPNRSGKKKCRKHAADEWNKEECEDKVQKTRYILCTLTRRECSHTQKHTHTQHATLAQS